MVTDLGADTSEVMSPRVDDLASGPVARIILLQRVGIGAHACWVEGDRMRGESRTPVLNRRRRTGQRRCAASCADDASSWAR